MKKRNLKRNRRGQTIVEYVLIICIVVVASIGLLSIFSDTVRKKISGIVSTIDTEKGQEAQTKYSEKESKNIMKDMSEAGLEDN